MAVYCDILLCSVTRCELIARNIFIYSKSLQNQPVSVRTLYKHKLATSAFSIHLSPHFHAPLTRKARHNEHISTHDRWSEAQAPRDNKDRRHDSITRYHISIPTHRRHIMQSTKLKSFHTIQCRVYRMLPDDMSCLPEPIFLC